MSEDDDVAERILTKAKREIEPALSRRWPVIWHRVLFGAALIALAWAATAWLPAPGWLLSVAIAWAALIIASAIYISLRVTRLTARLEALAAKAASVQARDTE
jgi:hypothetical protein